MGGPAIVNGKEIPELDNFYECKFKLDDRIWHTTENYFQAQKFSNPDDQDTLASPHIGPMMAWRYGQRENLPDNWEDIKVEAMYRGNLAKFSQNEDLKKILLSTSPHPIKFTESTPFWNKKNAEILSDIRNKLKDEE